MKITLLLFVVFALLVGLLSARDIPKDPSLEYEIVNPQSLPQPKKPDVIEDLAQSNKNKTFAYDPVNQKWTLLKPTDEVKNETLLWNQDNDKWLTQSFKP